MDTRALMKMIDSQKNSNFTTEGILKAELFATMRHKKQKRKFNGEPYVYHCIRVADTIKEYSNYNEILVIVALLHDILEDTDTTFNEIKNEFNIDIAKMVQSLTNDKKEIERMGKTEYLALKINTLNRDELLVKLADRLDNIQDLSHNDWSIKYAKQTQYVFFDVLDKKILNDNHFVLLSKIKEKINYLL
jgi:guanosine-3',5'-bis(diphosphate) 3'-pyrophosphohydrolase